MVFHTTQPNFSGGEVSPHLYSRVDTQNYQTWLKTASNFIVHPQGGVSNRAGTAYVNTAKYADKKARLIPFVVGEKEAYVLEMGAGYIRVHSQAGSLEKDGKIYEILSPYKEDALEKINYVQQGNSLFLVHGDYYPRKITRQADGFFSIEKLNINDGPFMLGNTDKEKKLRLICTNNTVVSEGVAAFLVPSSVRREACSGGV